MRTNPSRFAMDYPQHGIVIDGVCFLSGWCHRHMLLSALHLPLRLSFDVTVLPMILQLALFLVPSICGLHMSIRGGELHPSHALCLALAVAVLAGLTTWTEGWWQAALQTWSEGAWNELTPWQVRLLPCALVSWPAAYLFASANSRLLHDDKRRYLFLTNTGRQI
jgi:hypothetical protein